MSIQDNINFNRVSQAIAFIQQNAGRQPSLEEVAEEIHLSPFHFQRLFTDWAGVSPKKFLQYISVQYAKQILQDPGSNLFETAYRTGLSGTGRLHDLFVSIEGMTPGTFRNKGANLAINYSFADSPFGKLLVASTDIGICYMGFADNPGQALADLELRFPNARFTERFDDMQQNALRFYSEDPGDPGKIKLHLKGTDFQLKVWEALLTIPMGDLTTYGQLARIIGKPTASRAVGSAVGKNPIACLIPCHRVIQASGVLGGYMWGPVRKTAMIGWEAAKTAREESTV